ncbi:MAG: twin-arginine translocation signal domain-containing protein, partial [Selenomonadaceae bacterium]|nr:twin-arginine translocation signal domain-containing protein [Selenomonadaceae bacterium]
MFEQNISRREFLKLTSMTALAFAATNFFGDIHG